MSSFILFQLTVVWDIGQIPLNDIPLGYFLSFLKGRATPAKLVVAIVLKPCLIWTQYILPLLWG